MYSLTWVLLLSILILRFIYVVVSINTSLLFGTDLVVRSTSLFIHSLVDGYLGCFHFSAIQNKAAINIHVQVFLWT